MASGKKGFSGRTTHLIGEHNRENEPAYTLAPMGEAGGTFHVSGRGQLETVLIAGERFDPVFLKPSVLHNDDWRTRKAGPNLALRRVDGQGPGKAVHGCSVV